MNDWIQSMDFSNIYAHTQKTCNAWKLLYNMQWEVQVLLKKSRQQVLTISQLQWTEKKKKRNISVEIRILGGEFNCTSQSWYSNNESFLYDFGWVYFSAWWSSVIRSYSFSSLQTRRKKTTRKTRSMTNKDKRTIKMQSKWRDKNRNQELDSRNHPE